MHFSSIPPPRRDYRCSPPNTDTQISTAIIFLGNFKLCNINSCPNDGAQGSGTWQGTAHFGSSHSDSCPGKSTTFLPNPQPCCRCGTGLGTSGSSGSKELTWEPHGPLKYGIVLLWLIPQSQGAPTSTGHSPNLTGLIFPLSSKGSQLPNGCWETSLRWVYSPLQGRLSRGVISTLS